MTVNSDVKPGAVILTGDTGRTIPEAERLLTSKVLGLSKDEVGATESEVAEQVFRSHPDFAAYDEEVLPYGYTNEGELTHGQTGQFRQIGMIAGVPAIIMQIDRDWYEDDAGNQKFNRLDNYSKMQVVAGIENVESIGFVTSGTYQPSVEVQAFHALQATNTLIKVCTYGTAELARCKQESEPQPPSLSQLATEAYKVAQEVNKLSS